MGELDRSRHWVTYKLPSLFEDVRYRLSPWDILSDLAENIGHSKDDTETQAIDVSIDLVTSQVETRVVPDQEHEEQYERVFMV